ncbi:MAG TPA: hexose kinase [Oscillatoriaceae cyanobacterium]
MILTVTLNAAIDKTHLLPGFRTACVNRPQEIVAMAGGKGINVARVLRALGEPVSCTGVVAGHTGMRIEACLATEGIASTFHRLPHGESRVCLAVIDPSCGAPTEINEPGAAMDAADFAAFRTLYTLLLNDCRWVALSGSLPPGLGPDSYAALMRLARAAGKPVSLDTGGHVLSALLAEAPDVIKPNQAEAEQVLGVRLGLDNLSEAVAALLARGARTVALSLGAEGAVFADRDEAWVMAAPSVSAVNPIGSGDSFLAAFLAARLHGRSLLEAGRRAVAAGAANAAVLGAAACSAAEIEALLPQVRPRPLAEAVDALSSA